MERAERDRLVLAHRPLARRVAREASRITSSLTFEDLFHEALIGLFHATECFDPLVGVKFGTYAAKVAFSYCRRAQINLGSVVRTPAYRGLRGRVDAYSTDALSSEGGVSPGDDWDVEALTPEYIVEQAELMHKVRGTMRASCTDRQMRTFEESLENEHQGRNPTALRRRRVVQLARHAATQLGVTPQSHHLS